MCGFYVVYFSLVAPCSHTETVYDSRMEISAEIDEIIWLKTNSAAGFLFTLFVAVYRRESKLYYCAKRCDEGFGLITSSCLSLPCRWDWVNSCWIAHEWVMRVLSRCFACADTPDAGANRPYAGTHDRTGHIWMACIPNACACEWLDWSFG